jgi:hypothetical protein
MMSNTNYDLMMLRRRRRSVTYDSTELITDTAVSCCGSTNSILLAPSDDAWSISSGSNFKSKNHSPNNKAKAKNSGLIPFPVKLHTMLDKSEEDGLANVVSWAAHGRCFCVHKPKDFVMHVMPQHFKQSKMTSFRRQLNLYGFKRLTKGLDRGGYYHESFIRGNIDLAYNIRRMRIKGTCVRSPTSPHTEPNFNAFKQLHHHHHHHHQQQQTTDTKIDILFFEGRPFHYIDSSELTILKNINQNQGPIQQSSSLLSLANDVSFSSNNISEFDSYCDESICFPSYGSNGTDSEDDSISLSRSIDTKDDIDFFIKSIGIPTEISIKHGVWRNDDRREEYQQC